MNPLVAQSSPVYFQQIGAPNSAEDNQVELSRYFNVLYDNRGLIAVITIVFALLGAGYAAMIKPVYEANMLIHVEENSQKESKNIIGEMGSLFDVKTAATAEMELIRSRMVVSRAIDNLRLYITAEPKYFPLLGKWIAAKNQRASAPGLLGYGGYVWGNEKIDVTIFNVPSELLNREFMITSEGNGKFRVTEDESHIDFTGNVGAPLDFETQFGPIELKVDQFNAKTGAQFYLKRTSRLALIESVQKNLVVVEQGKQSGVIDVMLQGNNQQEVSAILGEISKEYMRQNTARKTEEADKSLSVLEKQLPELKQQLELSEAKYNLFRNMHSTIDLGEEAKISLQQSAAAKSRKIELEQKRTELLTRFTDDHPVLMGINKQLKDINSEIAYSTAHIKTLPVLEQEVVRLARDVKVNTDLYTALLNTAQQLRLITVAKMSNVRLVDAPMIPEKPIKPNRSMIVAVAVLLGLFLGILASFARKALKTGIEYPSEIEKILGVPVYATIPHSKMQEKLSDQVSRKSPKLPLLAELAKADVTVESLRNFRTALQFSMSHSKNNIVLITGPTAGVGKSFVAANLATVIASSGKRVLLIDGDLRNGHLHRYFDIGREDSS